MTYVGELGWELTVPVEHALAVHDALRAAGAALGARDAGYHAIESLRLEKGFRAFGRELTPDYTPVEAGLVFATALSGDKDFLGRAALGAHRAALAERRAAAPMVVDGGRRLRTHALGRGAAAPRRPPGRAGDQRRVGRDGGLVRRVGLRPPRRAGRPSDWLASGRHEVDVAGTAYPVTLSVRAPLD